MGVFSQLGHLAGLLVLGFVASVVLYFLVTGIYNVYFHPLSNFPGPKSWAASSIPFAISHARGTFAFDNTDLHTKYGEVVRMGPNQLSFINPDAWKDIHAYQVNRPHFTKDKHNYFTPLNGVESIHSTANVADHARHRRLLAFAFSEKAMREQESLLAGYANLLVEQLKKQRGSVDMVRWLNYATFDLTGDLTFGEPFGCLRESDYHPWIAIIFQSLRASAIIVAGRQFPMLASFLFRIMPSSLLKKIKDHDSMSIEKMDRRLAMKTDRPDFVTYLQRQTGEKGLSLGEFHSNAPLIMIAGSETTGTALAACLYFLLINPDVFRKLRNEFDAAIKSDADITILKTAELSYMTAALNETMRMHPPVPGDLPRLAPKEGITVAGYFLPPFTRASMGTYAAAHSPRNFRDAYDFIPERWDSNNPLYANDKKNASQPFSYGPRNCIGQNLAWAEMRLILSKILFNFDIELCPESKNWSDQKEFLVWEKHPLKLNLKPRH